jgi:hypothetical protein
MPSSMRRISNRNNPGLDKVSGTFLAVWVVFRANGIDRELKTFIHERRRDEAREG